MCGPHKYGCLKVRIGFMLHKSLSRVRHAHGDGLERMICLSGVADALWDAGIFFARPDTDSYCAWCQNREGHSPLTQRTTAFRARHCRACCQVKLVLSLKQIAKPKTSARKEGSGMPNCCGQGKSSYYSPQSKEPNPPQARQKHTQKLYSSVQRRAGDDPPVIDSQEE
jgi:hypothetical protein